VIICAYAGMDAAAAEAFHPRLVYLDERNRIVRTGQQIPTQAA
jgi:aspartate 1-decarboxylase